MSCTETMFNLLLNDLDLLAAWELPISTQLGYLIARLVQGNHLDVYLRAGCQHLATSSRAASWFGAATGAVHDDRDSVSQYTGLTKVYLHSRSTGLANPHTTWSHIKCH